jgi:hypothetical protein
MAKKLKTFEFTRTRTSAYPWYDWADGSIWQVVQGIDFTCKVESFRSTLSGVAANRGMSVRSKLQDGGSVVFQFYQKDKS